MPETSKYMPFQRCGYTVCYVHPAFKEDFPRVRVAKGLWAIYLDAAHYDEDLADDEVFGPFMDACFADAKREQAAP
jgi:hypothetical protein